jgi:hypothetical protein
MRRMTILQRHILPGIVCAALWASSAAWAAEEASMQLEDQGQGRYSLVGRMTVEVSPYQAWKVLTDYENIARFVSSLRKSEIKDSNTEGVVLEQEALGKKFFISRRVRVLLQIAEFPYRRIEFEDTLKKDFSHYKGSWEIQKTESMLEVVYRLDCQRLFAVPNFIAKDALKKNALELLRDVQREIHRRSQGGMSPC